MSLKNKKLPYFLAFLAGIACTLTVQHFSTLLEIVRSLSTKDLIFWGIWIVIFIILIIWGIRNNDINNRKDLAIHTLDSWEKLHALLIQKESEWMKGVVNTSLLLLSACSVYVFIPNTLKQEHLNFSIGVLAYTSLLNIFLGTLLPLVNHFLLSWDVQRHHYLNRFYYRIIIRIAPYWHSSTFFSCLIQAISITYIIANVIIK